MAIIGAGGGSTYYKKAITPMYNPWLGKTTKQIRAYETAQNRPKIPSTTRIAPTQLYTRKQLGSTPIANTQVQPERQPVQQPVQQTNIGGGYTGGDYALPEFTVDLAGIWETAGQMADNEINPQLAEIDRLLQEAGYTADESQRAINEAYPVARRSLQKSIYENMVAGEQGLAAMGTGRGGGRQELLARAGEREATGVEAIETQKQREIGAINRALESYRGQMGTTRTSLLGQRGALQGSYAEQLRGNRFNEASTVYNAALGRANLAESARQYNESLKASITGQGTTGQGGYLNLFTGTGGTTYVPTIEEINALLGGAGVSTIPPKPAKYKGAIRVGNVRW